ncbi:MAG: PQQ-binding-like beta-propeller repeat protein [Bacteroidales bacterium]
MKRKGILLAFILLIVMSKGFGQSVFEWRNGRTGIYPDKNLLKSWPETGPALVWEYQGIGNGYGSPVFTGDKMFVTGEIDTVCYLFAFDLKGNLLWKSECGREWVKSFRGSRSSPTVAGNLVYAITGMGNLTCFDADKGSKKWSVDMIKDLHGKFTLHGHSESPVVDGDLIFFTPGGNDTNVVALNRYDGKIKWICKGLGERPAYNSPNLIKLKDRNILVVFSAYAFMGIDTKDGKLLWTHIQDNLPVAQHDFGYGDTHCNTVVYDKGNIYYMAGDGNGAVKLKLSDDGNAITEIWRNNNVDGILGGIIVKDTLLFTDGYEKRVLNCIGTNSGKLLSSLPLGSGSLIMADGLIYFYSTKGTVSLIEPNPQQMKALSTFKLTKGNGEHFSHPVINNKKLYIRRGNTIMAFNIGV